MENFIKFCFWNNEYVYVSLSLLNQKLEFISKRADVQVCHNCLIKIFFCEVILNLHYSQYCWQQFLSLIYNPFQEKTRRYQRFHCLPLSYQFMILDKACTKLSCKLFLPCRFQCNLQPFIWVGFILFAWSINAKFFSFHSLAKCAFTSFALVWNWYIRCSNIMFFTFESDGYICNWFYNQFW